jgi:hypothetical protein
MKLSKTLNLEKCPHCSINSPNLMHTGYDITTSNSEDGNQRNWRTYKCNKCGGLVIAFSSSSDNVVVEYYPATLNETFEYEYLDGDVRDDFKEALICYSNRCYNAFASMCRRTIQSACDQMGTEGKSKVTKQIRELKEIHDIDDEIFEELQQIIIIGHDGTHPYLPRLSPERAVNLLYLMKDVLDMLFVRKAKIREAKEIRLKEIKNNKSEIDPTEQNGDDKPIYI